MSKLIFLALALTYVAAVPFLDEVKYDSIDFGPTITVRTSHTHRGTMVTLRCMDDNVETDETTEYRWYKDGDLFMEGPDTGAIRFKVRPTTTGFYSCSIMPTAMEEDMFGDEEKMSPEIQIEMPVRELRREKRSADGGPKHCHQKDDCKAYCTQKAKDSTTNAEDRANIRATWKCMNHQCACGAVL